MNGLIQPIISLPEATNTTKIDRLIQYCKDLDGTQVMVSPVSKKEDYKFTSRLIERGFSPIQAFYSLQAYSLRKESEMAKGMPFIHLEPDSIPLKSGWVKSLSDEYWKQNKPYLWSSDSHPPGDLVGGIGVYGPDTSWMIPCEFPNNGWDLWMYKNIRELIATTPLIQHKYGIYDTEGAIKTRDIYFPRDKNLLRSDSVIFHRDPTQSLIRSQKSTGLRFSHSGCMGDAIAALPSIRQLGGGDLVMTQKNNPRILRGERYEFIKPLLESQPYISSVTWEEDPKGIDYDFTDFRTIYKGDVSLAETQGKFVGIHNLDLSPWLDVDPDPRSKGKIVVARSPRYLSWIFPWWAIFQRYADRIIFIGLEEERKALESHVGMRVQSTPCKNALEMASLIAGSDCFLGNQSSPFWMATGLGKKLAQETYVPNPDSTIPRANAIYFKNESQRKQVLNMLKGL